MSVWPATSSDTTARERGMAVCAYAVVANATAAANIAIFFMLSSWADLKVGPYESEYVGADLKVRLYALRNEMRRGGPSGPPDDQAEWSMMIFIRWPLSDPSMPMAALSSPSGRTSLTSGSSFTCPRSTSAIHEV